jgi:DNA polymerase-3 subunit epsilon
MGSPRFAVLDVETTSGNPMEGRVMEVAVVALDSSTERIRWESLVDPKCSIPPFIRRLTGIDSMMLKHSPTFAMVVRTLETLTEGRIVVAHNVRFDMTALEHEFARTGLVFERNTLCTERTCRRLVPNLSHYNLGSLCRYFGISFEARHRASSDAAATAQLLNTLLDHFGKDQVLEDVMPWRQALRA